MFMIRFDKQISIDDDYFLLYLHPLFMYVSIIKIFKQDRTIKLNMPSINVDVALVYVETWNDVEVGSTVVRTRAFTP